MDADAERRDWAVPPRTGQLDGLDLSLLDRADPDERRVLLEAEHPELSRALRAGRSEVLIDGRSVNAELHLTLHEIVAARLWTDDPPETWQTARRLTELGYDRHEVLHMIMTVVSDEVFAALNGQPAREGESSRALAALPDSWETLREQPARNRAERRARRRSRG